MLKFDLVVKCILPAVLGAGMASQAAAGDFGRQIPAAARYGQVPAASPMMPPRYGAFAPAQRWQGMRPWRMTATRNLPPYPGRPAAVGHRSGSVPAPQQMRRPDPRRAWTMARYQHPASRQPIYGPVAKYRSTGNRLAQVRPPMAPPALARAHAPRQTVAMTRYQRPAYGQPIYSARPANRDFPGRLAQNRAPMAPPWASAPRQTVAMARYQRPAFRQPIYGPAPRTAGAPNRLAQARPPMMPPMWARAPRQTVAMARPPRPATLGRQPFGGPADRNTLNRLAQFRPPMPPAWINAPQRMAMYPFAGGSWNRRQNTGTAELAAIPDAFVETPAEQVADAGTMKGGEAELVALAETAPAETETTRKQAADKGTPRMSEFAAFSLIAPAGASELLVPGANTEQAPATAEQTVSEAATAAAPAN
jgi:hypothetical protein